MNILVYFQIQTVTPDPRQYMQQRQVYVPKAGMDQVAVEIEVSPTNLVLPEKWFEQVTLWELGQGDKPDTNIELVFTPAGWAKVMAQLEEPYSSSQTNPNDDFFSDEDSDF